MLTIQILAQKNHDLLAKCIKQVIELDCEIICGDFDGSSKSLATEYGCTHIQLPRENDLSKSRNRLTQASNNDWQFFIDPWEEFVTGKDEIFWAINQPESAFNIYHLQDDLLTKQTRLWKKSSRKFVRPVYETVEPGATKYLNCYIKGNPPDLHSQNAAILRNWKIIEPTAPDLDYYLSCANLCQKQYDAFLGYAHTYLFRTKKQDIPFYMTHYYIALVELLVKKNPAKCINHATQCLVELPTMAELWCLLGDAFVQLKQFSRAFAFYENAIMFGSQRLQDDPYPVEIEKYKLYPEKMMKACKEMLTSIHTS